LNIREKHHHYCFSIAFAGSAVGSDFTVQKYNFFDKTENNQLAQSDKAEKLRLSQKKRIG
jgi:hypothetical protein